MAFMLCGGSKQHHASMDTVCNKPTTIGNGNIPEINQDVDGMDSLTMNIPRSRKGFGFTITGSFPVRVGQVKEGSPACQSGLRKDDCIIRINGQNVSRSIADSVAKLIRTCETTLALEVHRPYLPQPFDSYSSHGPVHSTPCQSVCNDENMPPQQIQYKMYNDENRVPKPYGDTHVNAAHAKGLRYFNPQQCPTQQKAPQQLAPPLGHNPVSSSQRQCRNSSSQQSSRCNRSSVLVEGLRREELCHESGVDVGRRRPAKCQTSALPQLTLSHQELTVMEQERQRGIRELVRSQERFVYHMQFGVHQYLTPLKDDIISVADHSTLFQNIEQLAFHAESLLYQFRENSMPYSDYPEQDFLDVVGTLYLPTLGDLSHGMQSYCAGAKNAIRLLMELRKDNDFNTFLKSQPKEEEDITIGTFLQRPIEHMKNTIMHLQTIFSHTSQEHHDYDKLREVIETIRQACNSMTQNHARRCRSTFSLASAQSQFSVASMNVTTYSNDSNTGGNASQFRGNDSVVTEESAITLRSAHSDNSGSSHHSERSQHSQCSAQSMHSQDSGISHSHTSRQSNNSASSHCSQGCSQQQSQQTPAASDRHEFEHAPHCGYSQYMHHTMQRSHSSEPGRRSPTSSHHSSQAGHSVLGPQSVTSDAIPPSIQSSEVEVAAIDSEVLDIQNRLLFARNVKAFKIATATRHMIYAGELFYIDDRRWTKLYLVLLSDLLLITKLEPDNYLTVLEEPIVLQDIKNITWDGTHATEFQVTVCCNDCSDEEDHGCRTTFVFRSTTIDLKHTWQNIISQRIEACRTQQDRDEQLGRVVGHFI